MKKIIGRNICELRKHQDLTQVALAKFLSVSRVQISHYERGERNIPMAHLNKLADLFGVELSDLLEENLEAQKLNLAFAFRSNNNETDLVNIASFKKVVMSYLKMQNVSNAD
jgi:transcriptional regulator with XRE-family HTH domain